MTPHDNAVASLARAYALSEVLPLHDARVRDALDGVLQLEGPLAVRVTSGGLLAGDDELADSDGSVAELTRDLRAAGIAGLTFDGALSREGAESLLTVLRGAVEGDGSFPAPAEALAEVPNVTFRFAAVPTLAVDGHLLGGLFPEREAPAESDADAGLDALSAAPAPEVPDLEGLVERYLAAEDDERDALESELREAAAEARRLGAVDAVAEAVERLASDTGDPAEGPHLSLAVDLLKPGVAAQVASRLGSIRDEEQRERMIRVTTALGREMAAALVEALAETSDRAARRAFLDAMIALGDHGRAEAEKMLEDGRWFVVRNGAAIFGGIGTEDDVQHLTSALAHEDARVRRETVMALARIGGDDAGMLLLGMMGDADADVRAAVATALGALGVQRAVKPLLEALAEEDQQKALVAILRALGSLGDPGAVSTIEKRAVSGFFSRPSVPVRIAAYRALASIGTPHATELLEDAADDKDEDVRTAVRALLEQRRTEQNQQPPGDSP